MHPWQHAKFQKKIMSLFREKLQADGRMDGRTDTPYFFFGNNKDGCPKNPQSKIGLLVNIRGHVHLIIAVLGLWYPHLQLHETTLEKMKIEWSFHTILIDKVKLYFHFVKTQFLMKHSIANDSKNLKKVYKGNSTVTCWKKVHDHNCRLNSSLRMVFEWCLKTWKKKMEQISISWSTHCFISVTFSL